MKGKSRCIKIKIERGTLRYYKVITPDEIRQYYKAALESVKI
jgi:hypothetical protein